MVSHCILSICNNYLFTVLVLRAGFRLLVAPVPVHCFSITSVSCFGVRVSVMFNVMFVHYTFSSVWFAEWPPFGK